MNPLNSQIFGLKLHFGEITKKRKNIYIFGLKSPKKLRKPSKYMCLENVSHVFVQFLIFENLSFLEQNMM